MIISKDELQVRCTNDRSGSYLVPDPIYTASPFDQLIMNICSPIGHFVSVTMKLP
jgi:hypothetical protein